MNTLTPEQLDMIKRLQPLFKKRLGNWQKDDMWYSKNIISTSFYDNMFVGLLPRCPENHKALYIPKVYDWQNPERGLWEMIDWTKLDGYITHKGDIYFQDGESDDTDPFTALLKALVQQEGV